MTTSRQTKEVKAMNRPRSEANLLVSSRVDVRDLAVIVKAWYYQFGAVPKSTSVMVREALEALATSLVRERPELEVT
jgi:hypothetical protein